LADLFAERAHSVRRRFTSPCGIDLTILVRSTGTGSAGCGEQARVTGRGVGVHPRIDRPGVVVSVLVGTRGSGEKHGDKKREKTFHEEELIMRA
jgi:hypothetical protein